MNVSLSLITSPPNPPSQMHAVHTYTHRRTSHPPHPLPISAIRDNSSWKNVEWIPTPSQLSE
jgi:hypothetical protein